MNETTNNLIVPRYYKGGFYSDDAERKERHAFLSSASAYLNVNLPKDWRDYAKLDWFDGDNRGIAIMSVPANRYGSERPRAFRRVKAKETFSVEAKHIKAIEDYIASRKAAVVQKQKVEDDLTALQLLVKPVIDKYTQEQPVTVTIEADLYRFEIYWCDKPNELYLSRYSAYSTNIRRNGVIDEVAAPSGKDCDTRYLSKAREWIAEHESNIATVTALAEQIKADLPAEFFEVTV